MRIAVHMHHSLHWVPFFDLRYTTKGLQSGLVSFILADETVQASLLKVLLLEIEFYKVRFGQYNSIPKSAICPQLV